MEIKISSSEKTSSDVNDKKVVRESKKRNKKKHRKGKKKAKLEKKLAAISVVKAKKVLNYLDAWSHREETGDWKFCKSINNWLIKNWSNEDFLGDDEFAVFLEYVSGLEKDSQARRQLLQRTEKLFKETNPEDMLYKRCRSLIQILT